MHTERSTNTVTCEEMSHLLPTLVSDPERRRSESDDQRHPLFEEHLEECKRCWAQYSDLMNSLEDQDPLIQAAVPPLPPLPTSMALKLLRDIQAADTPSISSTIRELVRKLRDHIDQEVHGLACSVSQQLAGCYASTAEHIAAFRRMCHALEERFNSDAGKSVNKTALDEIIQPFFGDLMVPVRDIKVDVLERLVKERIIEAAPPSKDGEPGEAGYVARWEISPEYLINRLWGVSTHSRLNRLFEGGLRCNDEKGTSLLLEGAPGSGKTLLAMHVATAFAEQGCPVAYVATQDTIGVFLERLGILGYRIGQESTNRTRWVCSSKQEPFTLRLCDLRAENQERRQTSTLTEEYGATLTVYLADARWWAQDSGPFLSSLKTLLSHHGRLSCFVLDCLDDVCGDLRDLDTTRVEEMLRLPPNRMGIFLSSGVYPTERSHQQLRQKVDIIVDLSIEQREGNIPDRAIQITKCRTQGALLGRHYFSIGQANEEVAIYPSPFAQHSIWIKRKLPMGGPCAEKWEVGEQFDMNKVVGNDVFRGAAILLRGKQATHRLPIGLSFLASGLRNNETDRVLLLSLQAPKESLISTVLQYPRFSQHLLDKGGAFNSRVIVGCRPAAVNGPERILEWMSRELASQLETLTKHTRSKVQRVVIHNLASLWCADMFQQDSMFVPALIRLFKNENVTALFIDGQGEPSGKIGNNFDLILTTDRECVYEAKEDTRIRVDKSVLCNTNNAWYRISRRRASKDGTLDPCGRYHAFVLEERPDDLMSKAQEIPHERERSADIKG